MSQNRRTSGGIAILAAVFLWASSAAADETIGGACSGTVAAGAQAADGNNVLCLTTTWGYPAYQFGPTALACNTTNAGMVQWNGSAFQGCNGTTWGTLDTTTTTVALGSITTANPFIAGDLTSGFYTAAAATVDIGIASTNVVQWVSTGETVAGSVTAASLAMTATSTVITNGMYLSAANTLDLSTSGTKHVEISSGGNLNIATSSDALQLGGSKILSYADAGADTQSIAIGVNALSNGTATNKKNTAIGFQAAEFISTGASETAIGQSALLGNTTTKTTGSYNTAIGDSALKTAFGAAAANTAVGQNAGNALTKGSDNIFVGAGVGGAIAQTSTGNILIGTDSTTRVAVAGTPQGIGIGTGVIVGQLDVDIGYKARSSGTTSAENVAIGYEASQFMGATANNEAVGALAMTSSSGNPLTQGDSVALGYEALMSLQGNAEGLIGIGYQAGKNSQGTSSNGNTDAFGSGAVETSQTDYVIFGAGYHALYNENNGDGEDHALGYQAGANVGSGSTTVALGSNTMASGALAITGTGNSAVGDYALNLEQGATSLNTAAGYYALEALTTGQFNAALGYQAGYAGTAVTTESNNTFVGYQTQMNAAGYTNSTALGNGAVLTASNSIVLGNSSISTIYAQVTTITAISDRRLKKDIAGLDDGLGLSFIDKAKPVSYRYSNGDETLRYGFIAQDLETALPAELQKLVETEKPEHGMALIQRGADNERTYRVGYSELLAPIVKSIQQRQQRIEALKAVNARQAAELEQLEREISRLEERN